MWDKIKKAHGSWTAIIIYYLLILTAVTVFIGYYTEDYITALYACATIMISLLVVGLVVYAIRELHL